MSSTYPQRVDFEDHRFMRAIDLEDEQLYHLQRRWQHNLGLHSWGILCGLQVRNIGVDLRQPKIVIHKGMALDGYGRELVVTDVLQVPTENNSLDPAVTYDVWLTYNIRIDDDATMAVGDCSPTEADPCCSSPSMNLRRLVEQPRVLVRPTSARQSGSVTQPREVPQGDLQFSPERPMKFDALSQWPVFLCRLEWGGTKWSIDDSERHYAGLIAERIEVPLQPMSTVTRDNNSEASQEELPLRRTAILNGGHPERKDWRFAVLDIPSHPKSDAAKPDAAKPDAAKMERDTTRALPDEFPAPLSIRAIQRDDEGNVDTELRLQAERVVAEADVVMQGGAGLQFETTPIGEKPIQPTSGWGIYRHFGPPSDNMGQDAEGDPRLPDSNASQFADVLQISMPSSDQGLNSIAIGAVDADGKFSPILVVNNDESVDINGILRVHGQIYGVTSDLPPLDRIKTLGKLIQRLEKVSAAVREQLVTAVAEAGNPQDILSGIESSKKANDVFLLMLTKSVTRLGEATVFSRLDTTNTLREMFVGEAVAKLGETTVFAKLDTTNTLRELFVGEAVAKLGETTVFAKLDTTNTLRELFVGEAVAKLGETTVFAKLDTTNTLRELFVLDGAKKLDAASFVAQIPVGKLKNIVAAEFNANPEKSATGFVAASAASRDHVWKTTWETESLRKEFAGFIPSVPAGNPAIAQFAAQLKEANEDSAKALRDALIAILP